MTTAPQRLGRVERIARAKINLALHVTGRRDDEYHLLDSLVVFADYGDFLEVSAADETSLDITGPFGADLQVNDDNLILQAFQKLSESQTTPLPATAFKLTKNLPVSSGIGGGSADAAAALNGLIDLWELDVSPHLLANIGLSLGADVPVCLKNTTCRMSGVGEDLSNIENFPVLHCVLVNPGIGVSTPAIFKGLDLPLNEAAFSPLPDFPNHNWMNWLTKTRNDLQAAAISQTPKIQKTLDTLAQNPACQLARMSGSGATCFGLYDSRQDAENAALMIADERPDWWIMAVRVG